MADTLTAEEREDALDRLKGLAALGGTCHFDKAEAEYLVSLIATPELLQLGEAAVKWDESLKGSIGKPFPVVAEEAQAAAKPLLAAALSYAASVGADGEGRGNE